jgi:RNA recognition motif-containing protein
LKHLKQKKSWGSFLIVRLEGMNVEKNISGKKSVFVSNLPADVTQEQVQALFQGFGQILDVRVHEYVLFESFFNTF